MYRAGHGRAHKPLKGDDPDAASGPERSPDDRRELLHPSELGRRHHPDRPREPLARALVPGGRGSRTLPPEHAHRRPDEDLQRQHRGGAVAADLHREAALPRLRHTSVPVVAARFDRHGGPWSTATETVTATDARVTMSWYDCIEPFVLHAPPGFNDRPIGVFSTFFPARAA